MSPPRPADGSTDRDRDLSRVCSLDDPVRRRLYGFVQASAGPVSRDQASAALELDRATVAYHLDRLVERGLLAVSFARPAGRGGPGAGRPTKYYERVDDELAISLPPRDYGLVAGILARAVEEDPSGVVGRAVASAAAEMGAELLRSDELSAGGGQAGDDLLGFLARRGFEPYLDDGVVRLRNCPFHQLAQQHTALVCGMNLALLGAVVERVAPDTEARLDPAPTRCCVALVPRAARRDTLADPGAPGG